MKKLSTHSTKDLGCVQFCSNWYLENVLYHWWCLPSKHFQSSQKASPHSHSHHSHQAQAKGRREVPPVKPKTSPRPMALLLCLQAPPSVKVVLAFLYPSSLFSLSWSIPFPPPTHPSSSLDPSSSFLFPRDTHPLIEV